jgi:hypothetical protein
MGFIPEMGCVYSAARAEYLNTVQVKFSLQKVKAVILTHLFQTRSVTCF